MSGWSSVVSTSTTFEPPSASCLIGANIAFVSVGAIRTASGFLAATALTIGVCWAGVELVRALEVQADAELLRLRLGSAVHRDVELVALDARDERHVVASCRCSRWSSNSSSTRTAVVARRRTRRGRARRRAGRRRARSGRSPPASGDRHERGPPPPGGVTHVVWSVIAGASAAKLVEVDGADQHRADGDLLPERLDADDHEAVLQHRRDEHAEDGPEDRADAAEQARAADDDGGDRVQVVGVVAADRGGREAGEDMKPASPESVPASA